MKIKQISAGILGACMVVGVGSCEHKATLSKPREELKKYITPEELRKADETIWQLPNSNKIFSPRIAYWDSLLIESKIKKAYLDGAQMVKDSAAGKEYNKPNFELPFDKKVYSSGVVLRRNIMRELSQTMSARELGELVKNEPPLSSDFVSDNSPNKVHYFYQLLSAAKQKEAFNQGANAERTKFNK